MTAALATGGSDNTAGVRGYAAREASDAARELGLQDSQVAGNLMLEFVSRKIPLGEHRQLSYMTVTTRATSFCKAGRLGA